MTSSPISKHTANHGAPTCGNFRYRAIECVVLRKIAALLPINHYNRAEATGQIPVSIRRMHGDKAHPHSYQDVCNKFFENCDGILGRD